jgi:hypothetical protein
LSRLPQAETAIVDAAKVRDYLLNAENEQNRGKAGLFGKFGFKRERWQQLAEALRAHCATNEVVEVSSSPHGEKFVVMCNLATPDGRNPCMRSVWIINAGNTLPRLVTAY